MLHEFLGLLLAEAGQVKGSVLDMGCGTGDNVLEKAERGHDSWGMDIVPAAIDQAKAKAKLRRRHCGVGNLAREKA